MKRPHPLGSDLLETQDAFSQTPPETPRSGSELLLTGGLEKFQTAWRVGAVVLGRFRLRALLGQGGMGEVWEAEGTAASLQTAAASDVFESGLPTAEAFEVAASERVLQETSEVVALKRLRPSLFSDASARRRFLREMDALRRLDHPHIVQIREVFFDDLCFTMPLLEGRTLRAYLAKHKRLPLQATLVLMEGLLDALESVHAAGIIHRDLKPENLFLCETTEPPENPLFPWCLKLLDFGIALEEGGTRLTETRSAGVGTAYYMAPEQLEGEYPLTPAVDIYACGILLYELLTGRIFQANGPSIRDRYEALLREKKLSLVESHPEFRWEKILETIDRSLQLATTYRPQARLSLSEFMALLREQKEVFQKKRSEFSTLLKKEALAKCSRRPAPEVLADFRDSVLAAFPERTDFLPWLEGVSQGWAEAEEVANELQTQPSLSLEEIEKRWEEAKRTSRHSFVYDGHPLTGWLSDRKDARRFFSSALPFSNRLDEASVFFEETPRYPRLSSAFVPSSIPNKTLEPPSVSPPPPLERFSWGWRERVLDKLHLVLVVLAILGTCSGGLVSFVLFCEGLYAAGAASVIVWILCVAYYVRSR